MVTFQGQRENASEIVTKRSLASLRDHITRWQIERHRPWFSPYPPETIPKDAWDQPLQISPREGVVWSRGPEGTFQSPQDAGILSLAFEPYPSPSVGAPQRLQGRAHPSHGLQLSWDWPDALASAIGYRILRASNPGDTFQEIGTSLADTTEYHDATAQPGVTLYYRVQALLGPGSKEPHSKPSRPYAVSVQQTGAPTLTMEAGSSSARVGSSVLIRFKGTGGGSSLRILNFEGTSHTVGPGSFTLQLPWVVAGKGSQTVQAELIDAANRKAVQSLVIEGT